MDPQDVEDLDSAAESRLARKVASFGIALGSYYTLWRIQSEYTPTCRTQEASIEFGSAGAVVFRSSEFPSRFHPEQQDSRILPCGGSGGGRLNCRTVLSNSCKFSIGPAKIPANFPVSAAIQAVLRAAKFCQERFWCPKRHGATPLQASYSEQLGPKRQNSSQKLPLLIDPDGVLVLYLLLHTRSAGQNQNFELGAKTMFQSSILHLKDQGTAEERLWRAVITKSLEEWICGPLSFSRKAEQFLFEDNRDFKAVCSSAGMDPVRLRKRLKAIRARGVQKENIPLRVRTSKRFGFPQATGLREGALGA